MQGSSFGDWQLCWAFTGMHHNGTAGGDATAVAVTGLGSNLTDADLYTLFVPVGGLVDARVLRDASTGDSSGRGRLVFARRRVAEEAVRAMDGLFVGGTCLGVALEADPDSPPTPSRGLAYPSHVRFASVADAATVAAEAPRSACRVHVTNLTSSEMSRETVRRAFEPFGRVREVRLAGTGAAVVTFASHAEAAQAIVGTKLEDTALEALAAACSAACRPIDDKRGTIEFRKKVAGVLARRAAAAAYQRAGGK